jgi:hypothetical protein
MWMIYMKVKEVSRGAERWSIGMVGASTVSHPSLTEATQLSDRNINDGNLRTPSTSAVTSQRGSLSGNDRSRYAERTKGAAVQCFLYVIANFATHMWSFIVVLIEMSGGTTPFYVLFIENFFWPLQGFANVFVFLRPRIQSIQKTSPEIFYFTAAYHSVFHYDEVRQRLTESVISPVSPDEGSRPKSEMIDASDSARKCTGKEGNASSVPAPSGMNESPRDKKDRFQQVVHDEASSHHDADEEPTIAEDSLIAPSAGPKRVSVAKSVSFND